MGALADSGPQYWWKSDAVTGVTPGASLVTMTDFSGNGFHATGGGSTVTYQTGVTPLGGAVARFFSGGGYKAACAAPASDAAQSIVAVVKPSGGNYRTIVGSSGGGLQLVLTPTNGMAMNKAGIINVFSTEAAPLSTTQFSVIVVTYSVANGWKYYVDGTLAASGASTVTFDSGRLRTIGCRDASLEPMVGDMPELATFTKVLTGTEATNITIEMVTKWISSGGGGGSEAFVDGIRLFGQTYAGGAALPSMSASVKRSLLRRGRITPATALTVRRAMKANGTTYAAGDAWPAGSSSAIVRRLLRGRKIG